MRRFTRTLLALLAGAVLGAARASAQNMPDPHALFESRCLTCHGHAGSFARDHLRLDADSLVTSRGVPVATFLQTHKGGLPEAVIAPMLAMFHRQVTSAALYEQTCRFCHDRARDFARQRLILRDGRLIGRYSGHDTAAFLPGHARLTADQANRMSAVLRGYLDIPE